MKQRAFNVRFGHEQARSLSPLSQAPATVKKLFDAPGSLLDKMAYVDIHIQLPGWVEGLIGDEAGKYNQGMPGVFDRKRYHTLSLKIWEQIINLQSKPK